MRPKLPRTLSDRRKVFALVAVVTIAAIAIVETATLRAAHTQLIRRTDTSLHGQVASAQRAARVLTPDQIGAIMRLPDILTPDTATLVISNKGRVVYSVPVPVGSRHALPVVPGRATLRSELGEPFTTPGTNGVGRFRAIAGDVGNGATLVVAAPLTGIDGTIADLRREVMWITAVSVLLLGIILWRLLGAATKPTNAMIDVAARIGDGDFTARVDPADLNGDAARLGVALNQMVSRLEHAFAETSASEAKLRRFVADASHELRTPLTSIRGYAQLLRMGAAGDEAETATRRIDSEAARMASLVDDLLLLARLDQGRPLAREPVDVAAIVRDLGDDARMLEPVRPITVDVPDGSVVVLGDESRLQQLLTNLLGNVRRHTEPSTACALQVRPTETEVLIAVADNGAGMDADDAAHAFDRFYRADASRNRDSGGSGLGLAIAKAIVDAHGGDISLDTGVDRGTRVTIRLPRAHRDLPAAPAASGAHSLTEPLIAAEPAREAAPMRALGVVRPNPADPQCLNQHGAINDYCARHGWDIVDVLYGSVDRDVVVKEAIEHVEQRDADVLIAAVTGTLWETDHEARAFLARRQRHDWALVITEIGLDTTTSSGAVTASALVEPLAVPPCSQPVPRTDLVKRVSGTTDLVAFDSSAYLDVDLLEAALGEPLRERARILDFGCGCGRLLRRLVERAPESHFTGCDIDAEAIAWVRDALGVDASVTEALPPLPYDDGAFDLVIGFSVFTHLDEVHQDAWLPELHRVLAPGGAALLSLHGPAAWETAALTSLAGRPALADLTREREERGIVHWRDDGWESMFPDWYHTTFHTPDYVREHWRKWFTTVDVVPGTVLRNHDIAVARR